MADETKPRKAREKKAVYVQVLNDIRWDDVCQSLSVEAAMDFLRDPENITDGETYRVVIVHYQKKLELAVKTRVKL